MNYESMWKYLKGKMQGMERVRNCYLERANFDGIVYKISRVEKELLTGLLGVMESMEMSERDDHLRTQFYEEIGESRECEVKNDVVNNRT